MTVSHQLGMKNISTDQERHNGKEQMQQDNGMNITDEFCNKVPFQVYNEKIRKITI